MPKKSKKSKSKRTTLKQKYKVLKKVKEHHRKKAKQLRVSGSKPKAPKDPGIPGQWPFKEQLLKELDWQKRNILAKEHQRKEERRLARKQEQQEDGDTDMAERPTVREVRSEAEAKLRSFEVEAGEGGKTGASLETGSQQRAFHREFARVVEAADVVIEVLDARDPQSTRCADMERYVRRAGPEKKLVLLLNKIDLVPREVAEAWLKYLREELPTVAFKCSVQKQAANISQRRLGGARMTGKGRWHKRDEPAGVDSAAGADRALMGSECLGAETLLQLLKNYARNAGMKAAITVGVVGLPNVGKSSLINSLKRARVVATGNTPGVTRAVQQIHLDKHVTLLDSPGVVFASGAAHDGAAAALRNCVKVEQLEDPLLPVAAIVARCPARQLSAIYRIAAFEGADDLLRQLATARGKLRPGGVPDVQAAARIVLMDWNSGRIPYFTRPPERPDHGHATAAVVPAWGAVFDAEKVFANEHSAIIAGLAPLDDEARQFFESGPAGPAPAQLQDMDTNTEPATECEPAAIARNAPHNTDAAAMDDTDEATILGRLAQATGPSQTEALYAEDGQYNPHLMRAVKKRQKKEARGRAQQPSANSLQALSASAPKPAHEDYDFSEAWNQDGNDAEGMSEGDDPTVERTGDAAEEEVDLGHLPDELEDLPSEDSFPG